MLRACSTAGPPDTLDDVNGIILRIASAIKEDFAKGDLCVVDGWQLSRMECRVAALKLLWELDRYAGTSVCRKEALQSPRMAPPQVLRVVPPEASVGVPFNVLPTGGESIINVYGAGFQSGAVVLFDDVVLDSAVGNEGWMTAFVPDDLYAREAVVKVRVRNPDNVVSNVAEFEVVP